MSKILEVVIGFYIILILVPLYWANEMINKLCKVSKKPVEKWLKWEHGIELEKALKRKRGMARMRGEDETKD